MKQIQITKVENGYVVVVKGDEETKTCAHENLQDVLTRVETELKE